MDEAAAAVETTIFAGGEMANTATTAVVPDESVVAVADAALQSYDAVVSLVSAATTSAEEATGATIMKNEEQVQRNKPATVSSNDSMRTPGVSSSTSKSISGGSSSSRSTPILLPLDIPPPPLPLPPGWVMKESRSHAHHYYYYNQETGESMWDSPAATTAPASHGVMVEEEGQNDVNIVLDRATTTRPLENKADQHYNSIHNDTNTASNSSSAVPLTKHLHGRDHDEDESNKRARTNAGPSGASTSSSSQPLPSKVRVLHILKKHRDSRRPSSWRNATITQSEEEAVTELGGLMEVLQESAQVSHEELRATFEELARTESDCSSAKRGGDLGYFGPKKMQPAFEEAAFHLQIGQLSDLVKTSSGVHVLLRIG